MFTGKIPFENNWLHNIVACLLNIWILKLILRSKINFKTMIFLPSEINFKHEICKTYLFFIYEFIIKTELIYQIIKKKGNQIFFWIYKGNQFMNTLVKYSINHLHE